MVSRVTAIIDGELPRQQLSFLLKLGPFFPCQIRGLGPSRYGTYSLDEDGSLFWGHFAHPPILVGRQVGRMVIMRPDVRLICSAAPGDWVVATMCRTERDKPFRTVSSAAKTLNPHASTGRAQATHSPTAVLTMPTGRTRLWVRHGLGFIPGVGRLEPVSPPWSVGGACYLRHRFAVGGRGQGQARRPDHRQHEIVVRYQGGATRATRSSWGQTYKLSLIPSGILPPGVQCVVTGGVVINPQHPQRDRRAEWLAESRWAKT